MLGLQCLLLSLLVLDIIAHRNTCWPGTEDRQGLKAQDNQKICIFLSKMVSMSSVWCLTSVTLAGDGEGVHAQPVLCSESKASLDYKETLSQNTD